MVRQLHHPPAHLRADSTATLIANEGSSSSGGYKVDDEQPKTLSPVPIDSQDQAGASEDREIQPTHQHVSFVDRWTRKGKKQVGVGESLLAVVKSSYLNLLLPLIPLAWTSHFLKWGTTVTFSLSFVSILPLAKLFEFGAEQMKYYLGKDFGDLLSVTLHNAVEGILAVFLLLHCELALLKATLIGVVVLHLLLIPGIAFIVGGTKMATQDLHPHLTELNHTLLTVGVMSMMMPAALFAALDDVAIDDKLRGSFLQLSRGIAFCLFFVYVCSRVYLHNPPGDENDTSRLPEAPEEYKKIHKKLSEGDPKLNPYVCIVMLLVSVGLMATTAEWLVKALSTVKKDFDVELSWFGLILLPIVSYIPNGAVAVGYAVRKSIRVYLGLAVPKPPTTLAKSKAIDLSIQFMLLWMPFTVILGWALGKPMTLLFDLFEVAVLVASCFIVNYVTADAKTNWAEGAAMVAFYVMIVLGAWYYPGSRESEVLSACDSVAVSLQKIAEHNAQMAHNKGWFIPAPHKA